jgi:hypothetical protein
MVRLPAPWRRRRTLPRHFEDVERSEDVHFRAQQGVCGAGRHLEGGQMEQMRDSILRHTAVEVIEGSHVALDETNLRHLLGGEQGFEAMGAGVNVEDDGVIAALDEVLHNPGADEAFGAGNQESRVGG